MISYLCELYARILLAESLLATLFLRLTELGVLLLPPVAADRGTDKGVVAVACTWCLGMRPETDMAGVDTAITLFTLLEDAEVGYCHSEILTGQISH